MNKNINYVVSLSCRMTAESKKKHVESPSWIDVLQHLHCLESGELEYLNLIGPNNGCFTHMVVLAKPGCYHMAIFTDEDDVFVYKASDVSDDKVEIAGDYWPQYQVCTLFDDLASATKTFFLHGKPSETFNWLCFSEDE